MSPLNTDHCPDLLLSGNHFRAGSPASFHRAFVSAEECRALASCLIPFFLFGGCDTPRTNGSWWFRGKHSLCVRPASHLCCPRLRKAGGSPCHAWLELGKKVIRGCCLETVGSCSWGCFLARHSFLVLVGWEPECPASKRLL